MQSMKVHLLLLPEQLSEGYDDQVSVAVACYEDLQSPTRQPRIDLFFLALLLQQEEFRRCSLARSFRTLIIASYDVCSEV